MATKLVLMGFIASVLGGQAALADTSVNAPATSDVQLGSAAPPMLAAPTAPKVSQETDTQAAFNAVRTKTANGGSCAPGTTSTFQPVTADVTYFQLHFIDGGRAVPMVCNTDEKTGNDVCKSMLRKGLSFKVSDLEAATKAPDSDNTGFMGKMKEFGKQFVKGANYAVQLVGGAVTIPVGQDAVTFFLNDMNQRVTDKENDAKKARDAATAMHGIFTALLNCVGDKHATYQDGKGTDLFLETLFNNMAKDPKIDMGDDNTAIQKAVAAGTALDQEIAKAQATIANMGTSVDPSAADATQKPMTNFPDAASTSAGATTAKSANQ